MKLSLGADEKGYVVETALQMLTEQGHQVTWYGPEEGETLPWPQVARQVAEDVASGRSEEGILFCWTGTGVSIAANKVPGVRAALCVDAETARGARLWNNANVLCLSLRLTTEALVKEILEAWFNTHYQPNPEDDTCLAMIEVLERSKQSGNR
jgi:ribose 5-phosphate isomerase B